ncbi:MAG: DUF2071 domain-containing protein [Fuerstiella sp.]|nr:DUF2071 domain-containing protein [Fuerstiella sp.]
MSLIEKPKTVAGYQNWKHLVFLHWRVPPEQLQIQLPNGLEPEIFDGSAWLALVPFAMERVRPWWSPAWPGISWFLETNVRTYVRHESGVTGVWFFSLDANSRLAVWTARTFWNLNYIDCRMTQNISTQSNRFEYTGRRRHSPNHAYAVHVELTTTEFRLSHEGSLEHFLLERYTLITQSAGGRFLTAEVSHHPYEFAPVNVLQCHETFTSGVQEHHASHSQPGHAVYSPGVNVRVSRLEQIK